MFGAGGGLVWKPWSWATLSQDRAVRNARAATVECGRRRVERDEVRLYLEALTSSAVHPLTVTAAD